MGRQVSLWIQQLAAPLSKSGGRAQLHEGEILSLRIDKSLGENRYSVSLRGANLPIKSNSPLPIGVLLRVKVVAVGRRIELKILDTPQVGEVGPSWLSGTVSVTRSGTLPATVVNVLVQSMRRSGLPVTPEAMTAIIAMVPRSRRSDPEYVRFATILHDKDLHVNPETLEEFVQSIGSRRHSAGQPKRERGSLSHDTSPREEQKGTQAAGRTRSREKDSLSRLGPTPAIDLAEEVKVRLRRQVQAGSSDGAAWPALVNHRRGIHETWVIVPFVLDRQGIVVEGSIRILLDRGKLPSTRIERPLAVSRAVVVAEDVGAFEITGSPPRRVVVHADSVPEQAEIARQLPELREKLRNLGVEIDDTINGGTEFDGFTAETFKAGGVDAIV